MTLTEKDKTRFWSKVAKGGPDDCWEHISYPRKDGYRNFRVGRRFMLAHRVAFCIAHGYEPSLLVCHTCDNRACCNPAHFFLGTDLDNMRDCKRKGRLASRAGECNNNAKADNETVQLVRWLIAERGMAQNAIAHRLGLSTTVVSLIFRRRTWAHI